jgi:hypothetical protein
MHLFLMLSFSVAALDAPVTQVTVFTDSARVTRTVKVSAETNTFVFPTLPNSVDVSSIRVDSSAAEVQRVDIERQSPEETKPEIVKQSIQEIDAVDASLDRTRRELASLGTQANTLASLRPQMPQNDGVKPTAKLSALGWKASTAFAVDELSKVQELIRKATEEERTLIEKREEFVKKAQELSTQNYVQGWKVTAHIRGGETNLSLVYVVRGANWMPTWDLQFQPENDTVNLSLAGMVAQNTGENWEQALINLSTAIPTFAVEAPKLLTWKIGVTDRFVPAPRQRVESYVPPPPTLAQQREQELNDLAKSQLQRLLSQTGVARREKTKDTYAPSVMAPQPVAPAEIIVRQEMDSVPTTASMPGVMVSEEEEATDGDDERNFKQSESAPASPPPMAMPSKKASMDFSGDVLTGSLAKPDALVRSNGMSLSPPPAWKAPRFRPDSAVALANGYDLLFTSLQKETIPTSQGNRRVALWANTWPVQVERKIYAGVSKDVFLVAELKNPSQQILPGGRAQLFVGADPAGVANLKLVSPGEKFTLPLGIDRALKPVRNIQVNEATTGIISKDEVATYTVTIEIANPYKTDLNAQIFDQVPLSKNKDTEIKLIESKPTAIQEPLTGELNWKLKLPANKKTTVSFSYSIKRPRGWKLFQEEVAK